MSTRWTVARTWRRKIELVIHIRLVRRCFEVEKRYVSLLLLSVPRVRRDNSGTHLWVKSPLHVDLLRFSGSYLYLSCALIYIKPQGASLQGVKLLPSYSLGLRWPPISCDSIQVVRRCTGTMQCPLSLRRKESCSSSLGSQSVASEVGAKMRGYD